MAILTEACLGPYFSSFLNSFFSLQLGIVFVWEMSFIKLKNINKFFLDSFKRVSIGVVNNFYFNRKMN